ncbi:MAG: hypothetical protein ABI847_01000 [Anaerolineales bacterium]
MNPKLLDNYLKAVKTFLPRSQQDDIVQELSDDILSRVEAQSAQLGRPLTEPEQEAILKQVGNPVLVAGRYHPNHQRVAFGVELIGPMLFPLYIRVLGISLALIVVGRTIALFLLGEGAATGLLLFLVAHFAAVTAIFTVAQFQLTRHPDRWDPRHPTTAPAAPKDPGVVSRVEMIVELVIYAGLLLWLWSLRGLGQGPLVGELVLSPVWRQVYGPLLVLTAASLVPPLVNLFQPRWMGFRLTTRLMADLAWLGLVGYVLQNGPWVTLVQPPAAAQNLAGLNQIIQYSVLITLAASAIQVLVDAYRLLRHWLRRPGVAGSPSQIAY